MAPDQTRDSSLLRYTAVFSVFSSQVCVAGHWNGQSKPETPDPVQIANSQLTAGAPPRQEKCDEIRPGSGRPAEGSISCHFAGGGAEKEEKEEEKEEERCGAPEAQVEVGTCQKHPYLLLPPDSRYSLIFSLNHCLTPHCKFLQLTVCDSLST